MKRKIIKLTESDIRDLVHRVIEEQSHRNIRIGTFVKDWTIMIIDVYQKYENGWIEYVGYGVDDKKFYLLIDDNDPDLDIKVIGRFNTLDDLKSDNPTETEEVGTKKWQTN